MEQHKYEAMDIAMANSVNVVPSIPVVSADATTTVAIPVVPTVREASSLTTTRAALRCMLWASFVAACFTASALQDGGTTTFRTFVAFWVCCAGVMALYGSFKSFDCVFTLLVIGSYMLNIIGLIVESRLSPRVIYVLVGGIFGHLVPFATLMDLNSRADGH